MAQQPRSTMQMLERRVVSRMYVGTVIVHTETARYVSWKRCGGCWRNYLKGNKLKIHVPLWNPLTLLFCTFLLFQNFFLCFFVIILIWYVWLIQGPSNYVILQIHKQISDFCYFDCFLLHKLCSNPYKLFVFTMAVFSWWRKKIRDTVAFLFVCGNYCPTID